MKQDFTKNNFEGEQQLWFDHEELKAEYQIADSDFLGKAPDI
jgi:hypothetical protein